MRAYAIDGFGQPGSIRDMPVKEPGEGEILIRVRNAGINPFDLAVMAGYLAAWFENRFPLIPGRDASGTVERVGPGVTAFAPGDEVVGSDARTFAGEGTYAEFSVLPIAAVCHRPDSMSPELAACLPTSGAIGLVVTEWTDPKPGQTILVIGATGGVGGFVSQHLAHAGATVVTLNRPDHDAYARERGASATFDYSAPDLEARLGEAYPKGFDAFIDLSGDKGLCERMMKLIKPWGRCSSTAMGIDPEAEAARGLTAQNVNEDAASRIGEIVEMIESGKLVAPEVHAYPFEQVPDALAAQASRHVRGKLVLSIGS